MPDDIDMKAQVAAYYDAVSRGDVDDVLAMFAPDAVMRDPVGTPPAVDEAARRQRYAGIGAMFEAFAIEADEIVVCGSEAAARWAARGSTHAGREVRFSGISTFTFDDGGLITAMSAYWELAVVVAALT